MTRPVVLLLSTYPIRRPRHGGQIRLANIKRCYEQQGFDVIQCAVCAPGSYKKSDLGKNDTLIDASSPHYVYQGYQVPFIDDLLTSVHVSKDPGVVSQILERVPTRVHAVHSEQPWLWPLLEALKNEKPFAHAMAIFGSQNIEASLKSEILRHKVADDLVQEILRDIDVLEKRAAATSDLCLAVTESDAETLNEWNAREVVLAANGVEPRAPGPEDLEYWSKRLPSVPFAAYIASAHPPNFENFLDVCGDSLGSIPPNSRLVAVGSVSTPLDQILAMSKWSWLNMSRFIGLGELSDAHLDAVKSLASLFIIPILQGGGSNLKTAEAIHSGKPVITTPVGIRGFEEFIGLPGIWVVENPREFHGAVRSVLSGETTATSDQERNRLAEKLTWSACLKDAASRVARGIAIDA